MTPRTEAIWARMPETDRELIRKAPLGQRDRWIELWAMAEENERRRVGRLGPNADARERIQDDLDEVLLTRVSTGEYGTAARAAVAECARKQAPGASRRAFLRAARKAIRAARARAGRKAGA